MMDFLKQLTDRLRTMWVDLDRSTRKVLIALAGAVSIAVVALWSWTAGSEPTWREIAGFDMDQAKRQKVYELLKSKTYEIDEDAYSRRGVVRVKADRAGSAGLELVSAGIIDGNELYKYLEEANLTATTDDRSKLWLVKTQQRMEGMLRGFGPIETASVQIVPMDDRATFRGGTDATASVVCRLKTGHDLSTNQAKAIAAVLRGAVKGLKPENVYISEAGTGRLFPVPDEGRNYWDSYHLTELQKDYANSLKDKISNHLRQLFQNSFALEVVYGLDAASSRKVADRVDPSTRSEKTRTFTDKSSGVAKGYEPGADAIEKGPMALPPTVDQRLDIKEEEKQPIVGREREETDRPGATRIDFLNVIATINIDPTKLAAYGATIDEQKAKIADHIRTLAQFTADPADPGAELPKPRISVMFMPPFIAPPAIPVPTTAEEIKEFARQYGMTLFLAVIVIPCSLLLLRGFIKSALERRAVKELEAAKTQIEGEGPEVADWEAAEAMVARAKQQIKEMVQRNPRGVATVLKKWMAIPK